MVEETRDEPHMKESEPKAEEDQVMVEVEANDIEQDTERTAEGRQEAECTAKWEDKEVLENPQPNFALAEGLMAEDEEYRDDEYLEEFPNESIEYLEKERKEEMAKCESELKVGKTKVKFGDFDEVNAMVITLQLFFEARPDWPNYRDGDVFDEVESMVQMNETKEIEMTWEIQRKGMLNLTPWYPRQRRNCQNMCAMKCPPRKCHPILSPYMWALILVDFRWEMFL